MTRLLSQLKPDRFTVAIIGMVVLASFLPASGPAAGVMERATDLAITLLFFLHGAKLSRRAILAGIGAWKLHLLVLGSTFVIFPIIGALVARLTGGWMDPNLVRGFIFLCILPSTVQSSIAFTAIARGNVPAAVCSASASNLLGIAITPALAAIMLGLHGSQGGGALSAVESIAEQLLLPFVVGHLLRPWIGGFVDRHKSALSIVDRGSILLVVYTAFSAAVVQGLWNQVGARDLALILVVDAAILAVALLSTKALARVFSLSREDEVTLIFCGSKKSLATGVPMAGVLFPAAAVGGAVLPLMLFHQIQLMVCAVIARSYAAPAAPARRAERLQEVEIAGRD